MAELSEALNLSNSEVRGVTSTGFEGLSPARAAAAGLLGDWA